MYGVVFSYFMSKEIQEIQTSIIRSLKGQTYDDAKEILENCMESIGYNSIIQKEVF